jgi:hypothetical protein
MESERAVVIVDFKKDQLAVGFKRSEIMFTVRIVRLTEIVVGGDGFYDSLYGRWAKGSDAWRQESELAFARQMTPQVVIEGRGWSLKIVTCFSPLADGQTAAADPFDDGGRCGLVGIRLGKPSAVGLGSS